VASRADIGLRLNGRTQRRASSCQTSHAPSLPRVRSLPHEFRHRWHSFDRRWITRVSPGFGPGYLDKTTPRSPRNMGRACSELNHGFRQKIPGVSLAELPMGFAGLCGVWAALSYR
jgi:hypothetical protein